MSHPSHKQESFSVSKYNHRHPLSLSFYLAGDESGEVWKFYNIVMKAGEPLRSSMHLFMYESEVEAQYTLYNFLWIGQTTVRGD